MKTKVSIFLIASIFLSWMSTTVFSQLPKASQLASKMTIGWNIGNSLEAPDGETSWGNPKVNQQLIDSVSAVGFNTIRIPCAWDSYADQSTMEIDAAWLARVKEVVDYCYANDMYVILNIHWDGGWLEKNCTSDKQESVNKKQKAYWTQIANYFKNYDEHLLFASANEPHVEDADGMEVLLSYHQTCVDAVRATGGNNSSRTLIVQGPRTNIKDTYKLMNTMPEDQIDDRLMVEVHYYSPYQFCLMGEDASWGKMFYYWGSDYHSTTDTDRNATWGEEDDVEKIFNLMKTKFVDKGNPVVIGEWGAMRRSLLTGDALNLHLASRQYYYSYIVDAAIRHGMIPVYWDNGVNANYGFALFDRNNGAIIDKGGVDAIMQGAGIRNGNNIVP